MCKSVLIYANTEYDFPLQILMNIINPNQHYVQILMNITNPQHHNVHYFLQWISPRSEQ